MNPKAKQNGSMPAGPQTAVYHPDQGVITPGHYFGDAGGLTKREAFALAAMQGLCASLESVNFESGALQIPKNIADWSVRCADELLDALEKELA